MQHVNPLLRAYRPSDARPRADALASFDYLIAALALFAWLGMGSLPDTAAKQLALAILAAAAITTSLATFYQISRMSPYERRVDWLPLTAALSSMMVGAVLFSFYFAGSLYIGS